MPDWKVVDLLDATKKFFEKRGIDSARLDAEILLAHVLGCRRIELYVKFDQTVPEPQLSQFRELVKLRGERRPVKQLVGHCEFYSRDFIISPDVLTPRPDTELLVQQVIKFLPPDAPSTFADIGTGSGIIAISVALARPQAKAYAVDNSQAALEIAQKNTEKHGLADRIIFLEGDMLEPLKAANITGLDCIASNPPYVAESERAGLEPELAFEPEGALFSGDEGFAHIARLIAEAPAHLRAGGLLAIEMGALTAPRARAAAEAAGYKKVSVLKDYGGIERVLLAEKM